MRLYEMENDKGSYAAVTFSPETVEALKAFQYDNNIPNPLNPDEFHSTVMFSRKYIPTFKALGALQNWTGRFTGWDVFPSDDDNALVMKYECVELAERFDKIMSEYEATWDHEQFIPHVTLSYDIGDMDVKQLPKYDGPIVLINEHAEDLDLSTNWADEHK